MVLRFERDSFWANRTICALGQWDLVEFWARECKQHPCRLQDQPPILDDSNKNFFKCKVNMHSLTATCQDFVILLQASFLEQLIFLVWSFFSLVLRVGFEVLDFQGVFLQQSPKLLTGA